jgi:hypothetical protein
MNNKEVLIRDFKDKISPAIYDMFYNSEKNSWKAGVKLPEVKDFKEDTCDYSNIAQKILDKKLDRVYNIKDFNYLDSYLEVVIDKSGFELCNYSEEYHPYIEYWIKYLISQYIKPYKGTAGSTKNSSIINRIKALLESVGYKNLVDNNSLCCKFVPICIEKEFNETFDEYYYNEGIVFKNDTVNFSNLNLKCRKSCTSQGEFETNTVRLFYRAMGIINSLYTYITQSLLIFSVSEEDFMKNYKNFDDYMNFDGTQCTC